MNAGERVSMRNPKSGPHTYDQIQVTRKYAAGSGGSAFIGLGVIHGKRIVAIPPLLSN
jgi:hypothetical protein